MWNNYLRLGDNEIVNTSRVVALAASLDLPLGINCGDCPSIPDYVRAVHAESDDLGDITLAPWYDADDPSSEDFYGIVGLSIRETLASTREAPVVQRLGDGGVIGRSRDATRDVRVTGLLFAKNAMGIDYGMNWLSSATRRNACGQHGTMCGLADVEWLVDCPPNLDGETDEEYAETVRSYRRFLHDTSVTSGPLPLEQRENPCWHVLEVEFTITAQEPAVLGAAKSFDLEPAFIDGKSDEVRNLIRNPSTENFASRTVNIAVNYIRNPSFETNTNLWSAGRRVIEGTTPPSFPTISRIRSDDAPAGEYFGRLTFGQYPLEEDTILEIAAIAPLDPILNSQAEDGTPMRFGASIFFPDGLATQVGIRAQVDGPTPMTIEQIWDTSREDPGWHDILMEERLHLPSDMTGVGLVIFRRISMASGQLMHGQLDFDAAWAMRG